MPKRTCLLILVFLLSACSGAPPSPTGTAFPTATATITPSPNTSQTRQARLQQTHAVKASATQIAVATAMNAHLATRASQFFALSQTPGTATPSGTATPTATPTLDPEVFLHTRTPAPPALCPKVSAENAPAPEFLSFDRFSWPGEPTEIVLEYLNRYGPQPIVAAQSIAAAQGNPMKSFFYQDLTNDGVPELAMVAKYFHIFGCQDGEYRVLYEQTEVDGYLSPYCVTHLMDGNRNGVPEITAITGWLSQAGHFYKIIEWDGSQFVNLLLPLSPRYQESGEVFVEATGNLTFTDIDNDGIKEVVAYRGLPVWETYRYGIPWRQETNYYKWDGRQYVFYFYEFDEPRYRFHALQDGDRFTARGEYDKALEMYQRVIFDEKLEWWTPARRDQLEEEWFKQLGAETPIPTATPVPSDPNEWPMLAAYARFRILVLHLLRGWQPEAATVYTTLQEKFPASQPGAAYAEMAAAFWNEYQASNDIGLACDQAIGYAAAHPEILTYLGSDYHGSQSYYYQPPDVCPFK